MSKTDNQIFVKKKIWTELKPNSDTVDIILPKIYVLFAWTT